MLARLALLFILVPIVELALLVRIGQWAGLWPTIGLVVTTGLVGAALARAEGLRTLVAFQAEVSQGRLPGQALLDGLAILVGGAFLLTPGLLTDVAGFLLLFPPSRRWLQRRVRARIEGAIREGRVRVGVWSVGSHPDPRGPGDLDPRNEVGGGVERPGAGRLQEEPADLRGHDRSGWRR
jgi:UPF0716 protein FxsA